MVAHPDILTANYKTDDSDFNNEGTDHSYQKENLVN